jgi:hypothetical protein
MAMGEDQRDLPPETAIRSSPNLRAKDPEIKINSLLAQLGR